MIQEGKKTVLRLQAGDGGKLAAAAEQDAGDDDDEDDDEEFEHVSKLQQRIDRYESILNENERTLELGVKNAKHQEQNVEQQASRVSGSFSGADKTLQSVADGKLALHHPPNVKEAHMVPTLVTLFLMANKPGVLEKFLYDNAWRVLFEKRFGAAPGV